MSDVGTTAVPRVFPRMARLVGLGAATLIALATLTPMGGDASQPLWCLTCGRWLQDGVDNVALFVPLGLALALSGWRPMPALLVGGATSIGIELAQHWLISGRDTSILDVVTNATGTWLGAAAWAGRWWWPASGTARRLVGVGTLLWVGQIALDPLALQAPANTVPAEVRVRRRPVSDDTGSLGFRLTETRIDDHVYEWDLTPATVQASVNDGRYALVVRGRVLRDAPDGFLTSGIYGPNREVVGVVTVERGMVRGRPAQRAAGWGLMPAYAEADLPVPLKAGDSLVATMSRTDAAVTVDVQVHREAAVFEASAVIEPSVRRSWRLLAPEWVGRRAARYGVSGAIDAGWLFVPPVLLALWVTASRGSPLVPIVVAGAGVAVPRVLATGLRPGELADAAARDQWFAVGTFVGAAALLWWWRYRRWRGEAQFGE